jgi:hypothetical protein
MYSCERERVNWKMLKGNARNFGGGGQSSAFEGSNRCP